MSNSLVFLSEDKTTPLTDTAIVASALGKSHHDVIELARRYSADLSEFGCVAFKTTDIKSMPRGGSVPSKKVMQLNEQQATLLITYMRNSPVVRKFKVALVRAFFEMREELHRQEIKKLRLFDFKKSQLSKFDLSRISAQVHATAKSLKCTTPEIYHLMYVRFQVPSYKLLDPCDVNKALCWLDEMALRGEYKVAKIYVTRAQRRALQAMAGFTDLFGGKLAELEKALLDGCSNFSRYAGLIHDVRAEFLLRKKPMHELSLMFKIDK